MRTSGVRWAKQSECAWSLSCIMLKVSAECVRILCDHYQINVTAGGGANHFQPFLMHFPRLNALVLKFFLRCADTLPAS